MGMAGTQVFEPSLLPSRMHQQEAAAEMEKGLGAAPWYGMGAPSTTQGSLLKVLKEADCGPWNVLQGDTTSNCPLGSVPKYPGQHPDMKKGPISCSFLSTSPV